MSQLAILRMKRLKEKVGLHPATIYRMVAEGDFPAPVKVGRMASGWVEEEVDAFILKCIAEREAAIAEREAAA